MDKEEFYNYVLEFYNGDTGIYKDVAATYGEVVESTRQLIRIYNQQGQQPHFDSVDREWVRDNILEGRNKVETKSFGKKQAAFKEKWGE